MAAGDIYLRSSTDKGEVATPSNLRLGALADRPWGPIYILKICGVVSANISKVAGVAWGSISKVDGVN